MPSNEREFQSEIDRGERFSFGKNWARFLSRLNEERIALAVRSLANFLEVETLEGKTFLDVGSGSGLFSLAARRLGAHVHSFDYDPDSVGCTQELRRRFFPEDDQWKIERGSVLDKPFLDGLGTFDIVYSWGVLHHTGQMWTALENVKPLVSLGGKLFIAIYNDQGRITDEWARVKKRYNALPSLLALPYALAIIAREERKNLSRHLRHGTLPDWFRTWRDYAEISTRGMSRWHDWIDWIGGHPYERATIEKIADFYADDGFKLDNLFDCSDGYGCNEFVFTRQAAAGTFIDSPIFGGQSFARRFGRRVHGPFSAGAAGVSGWISEIRDRSGRCRNYLLVGDEIKGEIAISAEGQVTIAPPGTELPAKTAGRHFVVAAERRPLAGPFRRSRGHMFVADASDIAALCDHSAGGERRSPVGVFENGRQLFAAHSTHDDIVELGGGRFSHWGGEIYFSASDNSDPITNGRHYELLIAWPPGYVDPDSIAARFGKPLEVRDDGSLRATVAIPHGEGDIRHFLFIGDHLLGEIRLSADGQFELPPGRELTADDRGQVRLISARRDTLEAPYSHVRGLMWEAKRPDLAGIADNAGSSASPLVLLENGQPIGRPHAPHTRIAEVGGGLYSHWDASIYLSTRDGSDPNRNGAAYEIILPTK